MLYAIDQKERQGGIEERERKEKREVEEEESIWRTMFVRHCERQSLTQFAHVSPGSHFPSPHKPTKKSVRILIGKNL